MRDGGASTGVLPPPDLDRIRRLQDEGRSMFERFDRDVRTQDWHPFVPAAYDRVLDTLLRLRAPGLRFLEFGSATGVITIMADMLGYEAYGIELDPALVDLARSLAATFDSRATFVAGSFLPDGYRWVAPSGDTRRGTIGDGISGYRALGLELDAFDYVFAYPWPGEDLLMQDIVRQRGGTRTRLLQYGPEGVQIFESL
ncbi:MAG TPA: class I SAM-dependent methyltransferase [Longimicrobiales bacterium]